jgi:hypothetical protein
MYATCLHCAANLGANESIEALPIGRRLAFDPDRGRLWVVCRACERWNLTPFDTRWEALEQCERAFRATRIRVSTDNIGMARLRDGTDLVRIGAPQRPEFSAWRYGDQFGRRLRRNVMLAGGSVVGVGLAASGLWAVGASVSAIFPIINIVSLAGVIAKFREMSSVHIPMPDGTWVAPMGTPRLIEMPDSADGWGIDVGVWAKGPSRASVIPRSWYARSQSEKNEIGRVQLPGQLAVPLLRRVLPQVNRAGARRAVIHEGVQLIEEAGGPEQFARWATGKRREWAARSSFGDTGDLNYIPVAARLAFEMALHEDSERRAMEGELAVLAAAWQQAEEIAAISDKLAVPARVDAALKRLR